MKGVGRMGNKNNLVEKLRSYHPTSGYSRFMRMAADRIEKLESKVVYPFAGCKESKCSGPGVGKCSECGIFLRLSRIINADKA